MTKSEGQSRGTWQITSRTLRRFLPGEISGLVLGVGILLLATFVALFQPWPLKIVIDSVLGDAPPPRVVQWLFSPFAPLLPSPPRLGLLTFICAGLLVIELMIGGGKVLSTYVLNAVALRLVFRVRCALFDHLQRQSLAFHDAKTVGDSLYRVTWDSYCIQSMFSSALVPALTASLTLAGIVLVLLSRDPLLALAAVVIAGPLIVVIQRMERPMTEQASRVHEHESGLSARVQETLSSIRAVQAFGREQHESERFRDRAVASLAANLRLILLQSASQAIVGLILAAGTGAVIWICARGVLSGRLSSGEVVLLVAYAVMLFKPLETLAYTAATAQSAAAEARRVWAVLDATPDVADTVQGRPLPSRARGQVTFDRVSFAYGSGAPVLHEVSLELRAGSAVALVGRSGAGKTTLASLVPRFYDPTGGRVLLDGDDLRDITLESLRRNIAIVTQEPVLFATSVRDNIVYGRPDATEREVEVAARAAGAHEFIAELPDGYDTVLAERGATLSGGQRQRISIARAFLKDAPILILDEPTSALDAHSEQHLLTAFGRLMRGRTTIIIAHRMSTVRIADLIVVLEAGRIVEAGTHADLLARPASFAGLYRLQVGGVETSATAAVY